VGYARFGSTTWPGVWHGTAVSCEPLPRPVYPENQGSGGFSEFLHAESSSVWTDGNYLYAAGYVKRWFYVASVRDTDAVLWSRPISSPLLGDFNGDNIVDQLDYDFWKARFGTASPGIGTGSGSALPSAEPRPAAVPEPCSLVLLATAAALGFQARRRSQGSLGTA